jgi:hypothetical protein
VDAYIYLVPEAGCSDPVATRAEITRLLQEEGIISTQQDYFYRASEHGACYVVSDNSRAAFTFDENEVGAAFELCEIYGHARATTVPQGEPVEPRCPACGADFTEVYNDFICSKQDVRTPLACPSCHARSRLDALKGEPPIFITNLFLCFFENAGWSTIKPDWLDQLNRKTGMRFRAVTYWG